MRYSCLLLFLLLLFSCKSASLKNNPTYKLSQQSGIVTDSTFLFIMPEKTGKIEFPDMHCFDKTGQPVQIGNCANGINGVVASLGKTHNTTLKNTPDLKAFLNNNKLVLPTGKRLTETNLPKKDFYVFYTYMYMMLDYIKPDDGKRDTAVLHTIRMAQQTARENNVALYISTPATGN